MDAFWHAMFLLINEDTYIHEAGLPDVAFVGNEKFSKIYIVFLLVYFNLLTLPTKVWLKINWI